MQLTQSTYATISQEIFTITSNYIHLWVNSVCNAIIEAESVVLKELVAKQAPVSEVNC
jgi:hypothetical protein